LDLNKSTAISTCRNYFEWFSENRQISSQTEENQEKNKKC